MTSCCTLGSVIRARRLELKLTQEELACRIGLRQSDISRLERDGVVLPRRQRLAAIAAALEIPLGELLLRSGWNGADRLLSQTADPTSDHLEAPRPTVIVRTEMVPDGAGTSLLPMVDELRKAIERSKETCVKSQRLRAESRQQWGS